MTEVRGQTTEDGGPKILMVNLFSVICLLFFYLSSVICLLEFIKHNLKI
jgi:hypothetical protein